VPAVVRPTIRETKGEWGTAEIEMEKRWLMEEE